MISRRRLGFGVAAATRVLTVALIAVAAPERGDEGLPPLEQLAPPEVLTLSGAVFHVQGLDVEPPFIYVSSVETARNRAWVHKFTVHGTLVARADLTDGPRYHSGGLMLDGETLWVPVAEYRAGGSTRIERLDKRTLQPLASFIAPDHIGAVAVGPDAVYGANWNAAMLHVWDRQGRPLRRVANVSGAAYQDMKIVDGALIAAGPLRDGVLGVIDVLDPLTLSVQRRMRLARGTPGAVWMREGMTIRGGKIYLLPNDGRNGRGEVFAFPLDALAEISIACADAPAACGRTPPVTPAAVRLAKAG